MSWATPIVLGLILPTALLVWWLFRPTPAAGLASFANIRRLWADHRGLADSVAVHRRRARGILCGLAALLTLIALARPQWGKIEETTYDQSREVLLALDLSRSMLANDVSPTRLDRAKLLIGSLLDELRGERVGLVVFAGTAFLQSPMSADYEVLRDFLHDLDPSYLPQAGTEYGAMLQTALQAFGQQGDGDRYLVVLSDGEAHDEEWKSLLPALKQKGIRIVGLGVGTPEGALLPAVGGGVMKDEHGAAVLSRLEPKTLQQLAEETGGSYRDAATWVDIADLVRATVDQGRTGNYVEQKDVRLSDQFQWFLAPALIFFLLSYWLDLPVLPVPQRLRRRQNTSAPSARRMAVTTALLVALAVADSSRAATTSTLPAAPQTAASALPPAASLQSTVEKLSNKPSLAANDYASLASTTINVISQPDSLHGPSRIGVIDDALSGVDEGEKIDAHAADWPQLRQQLERLKHEEEKKQQAQQNQQPQKQQQKGNGGSEDQKSAQSGGQDSQKKSGGQRGSSQPNEKNQSSAGADQNQQNSDKNSDSSSSSADAKDGQRNDQQQHAQGGGDDSQTKPNEQQQAAASGQQPTDAKDSDDKPAEPKPLKDADAGFGKLEDAKQQEKPDNGEKPGAATRLVGGGPVQQQPNDGQNPALVETLNRMQRIKDGDSPATLFDRMNQADGVQPPKTNGKNW